MDIDMAQLDSTTGIKQAIHQVAELVTDMEQANNRIAQDRSKSYCDVIQVIADGRYDAKQVAIDLAKRYPDIFIELTEGANEVWESAARSHLRSGQKIEAIKLVRQITGMGLKDSKDAVEDLMEREPDLYREYLNADSRNRGF